MLESYQQNYVPEQHLYLPCQPNSPINAVAAPMVAASDYAFRCLIRQYGVAQCTPSNDYDPLVINNRDPNCHDGILTFTQMLHARHIVEDETFFKNHVDLLEYCDNEDRLQLTTAQRNVFGSEEERSRSNYPPPCENATKGPVIAQLAGHDPKTIVQAAQKIIKYTHGKIAGVDLNLGCPQNIARKGNYGAYLMENHPSIVCDILKALRQSVPHTISVSAKIRLPFIRSEQKSRLEQLCDTGINFLTIHGRDYSENKSTVKHVHVDRLKEAIQLVNEYHQIPVIVNGGIEFMEDAILLKQQTGASAIMSSEAILECPMLLGQINTHTVHTAESSPKERFLQQTQCAYDYIQWCYFAPPVPGLLGAKGGSFNVVRGHLFKILYRYLNDHIDLRNWLGNGWQLQTLDQAKILVDTLRERYMYKTNSDWDELSSSKFPNSTWYRRHRASKSTQSTLETIANTNKFDNLNAIPSIDERKENIREQIAKLRMQKKQSNYW